MQALNGIRILDLTRLLPGPYCTMILADFGAEVIKVEHYKEGDYARWYPPLKGGMGYRHIILNRNKKSFSINLKLEKGKDIFRKLAKTADVIVESFRPSVMKRLGLDYSSIKNINPRIIYCSITGFGQDGPNKMMVGHDLNYVSLAGITSLVGERGGRPYIPPIQIADITGGLMGAIGILIALQARRKSGKGQYVDISMHDAAVAMLPSAASFLFGGHSIPRRGASRLTGKLPHYNIYRTKDNRYLSVAALEKKFWIELCKVIDRIDLLDAIDDEEKYEYLFKTLESIFSSKTSGEWVEIFSDKNVCVAPVKDIDEVFDDPQVRYREMVVEMKDPMIGVYKQLGIPIKLSDTPGFFKSLAPKLGEHTNEILKEIGFSENDIIELKENNVV